MKIILDVDSVVYPLTGIGRYVLSLAQELKNSRQVDDVKFIVSGRLLDDELKEGLTPFFEKRIANNGIITKSNLRRYVPFRQLLRLGYQRLKCWRFQKSVPQVSDYIYHAPNYQMLPFTNKSVVTIHDLSVLRHPECHPDDRASYWENEIHSVAKKAQHIITVSEFQRQEIVKLLDVKPDKVSVVYLGVEPKFKVYSEIESKAVLDKYNLQYKRYSLVVSTIEPRKNFTRLLEAFEKLPPEMRLSYPLAVVGDKGWGAGGVHELIARLVEKKEAVRLGYVDEQDLPKLYSSASVFLYPSIYEGFGLPVLEAMASGTAVLSSNTSSIPEVAGDACLLVDPYSVNDIAQGWRDILENKEMRDKLSHAGLQQAQKFSWQRCAEQTIDVYKKLKS